jgi:hypothetical protein
MINNIFKHTSRSYYDIYNALIAAYPNKPTWLFEEMSGLFDFISELINRVATDILYPETREAAYGFAHTCDYEPVEADGATTTLTITLTGAMSKSLAAGYQVGGISTSTGENIIYELTAVGSSGGSDTITVAAKQKRTYTNVLLGTIDSDEDFADFPIDGYTNIIKSSIGLEINSLTWTRVDDFDDSDENDRHFVLIYQSSGKVRYGFGDGVNGMKPTLNSSVYGTFEVTKGLKGRAAAGTITNNVGLDNDIESITNTESSEGNDAESISSIIRNARASVRLRDVVWSQEDLETAARMASSSVVKALGQPNTPDVGQATILIIPSGGGNPSSGLKSIVDAYVTALTQFGVMPITVDDPNYVSQNINAYYTCREGFDEDTVENLLEFAMTLITCAYDNQVIEHYEDYGINSCRENVINVLWSWAFTEDENEALEFIIKKWEELLGTRDFREFGQDFEVGDVWIIGNSLYQFGVDEWDVLSPTSNTSVDDDEIIGEGTIIVSPS